jgi:hypothetical protein
MPSQWYEEIVGRGAAEFENASVVKKTKKPPVKKSKPKVAKVTSHKPPTEQPPVAELKDESSSKEDEAPP